MFRFVYRYYRAGNGCWHRTKMAWYMVAQFVCQQCRLQNTPLSALILACGLSVIPLTSSAQQSTQYGPFELHHSIVYTTFLTPDIAAEYGITRGADKAILTLSVRDTTSGEIAGRPMSIEGRTWDLIWRGAAGQGNSGGSCHLLYRAVRVFGPRVSIL